VRGPAGARASRGGAARSAGRLNRGRAGARQRPCSAPRTRGTPEEARRSAPASLLSPPHQGDA
jgi:hypothetical protein